MQKFSVAISVYKNDNPAHFDRALQSITIDQSIKPDEIVLVVDGPISFELDAVINKYAKLFPIFKIIRLEKNGGLGNALKLATENASFDLIARMDSDDIALSDRFEQQLKIFSMNRNLGVVGGNISEFINEERNIVSYRCVPQYDKDIKSYMKKRCPFNHNTTMIKKTVLLKSGGYCDFFYNEDYYLWIRMALKNAEFYNIPKVLCNARVGKEMFNRRGGPNYFRSEKKIQTFMLKNKMISVFRYLLNVCERFIIQVIFTNKIRGWVLLKIARSKENKAR